MVQEYIVTTEGLEKIKKELSFLKEHKRKEVIERIQKSREFGDISENSEYEEAKNEQAFIEGRIQELEDIIKHAKVVTAACHNGVICIGSKVAVNIESENSTFQIVGASEGNPTQGKISADSPLGKALLGKKTGDKAEVVTSEGKLEYKILKIE